MELLVNTTDLLPGFYLAKAVVINNRVFLNKGIKLTTSYIKKLSDLAIDCVTIKLLDTKQETDDKDTIEKMLKKEDEEAKEIFFNDTEVKIEKIMKKIFNGTSDPLLPKDFINISNTVATTVKNMLNTKFPLTHYIKKVESFHNHTYEHSWNVFLTSMELLKQSIKNGLCPRADLNYAVNIGMGTLLHDIGKNFISPDILNKQGPLTDWEYQYMQEHVNIGFDKLKGNRFYSPMAKAIVLHHHRKWDGSGYGSKNLNVMYGKKIPFQVRLVSIADAYDALVSDRIFRKGLTSGEALTKIESDAGVHFDPEITGIIRKSFSDLEKGNLILLRNGFIVNVDETVMCNKKIKGTPVCSIFGITDNIFDMDDIERADIVARANGVPHLKKFIDTKIKGVIPLVINAPEMVKPLLEKAFLD